jgi:hypothetical protein
MNSFTMTLAMPVGLSFDMFSMVASCSCKRLCFPNLDVLVQQLMLDQCRHGPWYDALVMAKDPPREATDFQVSNSFNALKW